jgi:putative oxidoreductase
MTLATTSKTPSQTIAKPGTDLKALAARYVLGTDGDPGALIARLALAGVFFPHGAQKVLGWFGGHGFSGTYGFFTQQMGIPAPFALAAIFTEFLAPLALVLGIGSRVAALGIAAIMVVATLTVHLPNGFFMNWFGGQKGEGFEYHLLAFALALVVIVKGGGLGALDAKLAKKLS